MYIAKVARLRILTSNPDELVVESHSYDMEVVEAHKSIELEELVVEEGSGEVDVVEAGKVH